VIVFAYLDDRIPSKSHYIFGVTTHNLDRIKGPNPIEITHSITEKSWEVHSILNVEHSWELENTINVFFPKMLENDQILTF
jgi:hypothetical protein